VKEIPFTHIRKPWFSVRRFARKLPPFNNILWAFPTKFYPKRIKYLENMGKLLFIPYLQYDSITMCGHLLTNFIQSGRNIKKNGKTAIYSLLTI
jgi:hypothetical protein